MNLTTSHSVKLAGLIILAVLALGAWVYTNRGFREGTIELQIPEKYADNALILEYKNCHYYSKVWQKNNNGVTQNLTTDGLKKCDITFRPDFDPKESSAMHINLFNEQKILLQKELSPEKFGPSWRGDYKGKEVLLKIRDGSFGLIGFVAIGKQDDIGFIADLYFRLRQNQITQQPIRKKYMYKEVRIVD